VPANVCKVDVKMMVNVVLSRMRFRSCAVMQDAMCACFQANAGTACVVDIGEGKTSVSVVEDGMCIPCSALHLAYGGEDVSNLFLWLLRRGDNGSGSREPTDRSRQSILGMLDEDEPTHVSVFRAFKDRMVYVLPPQQELSVKTDEIQLARPGEPTTLHKLRVLGAACIPPLGFFSPKLFGAVDWSSAERKPWADAEEVVDDEFIHEMLQNRPGGGSNAQDERLVLREDNMFPEEGSAPGPLHQIIKEAINRVVALHEHSKVDPGKREDSSTAQEVMQRLYANIILSGGSSQIKGLAESLETRLYKIKPASVSQVTVMLNPKSRPSDRLAWCGACIVAAAECHKEVFVKREEWSTRGVHALKERVCFPW